MWNILDIFNDFLTIQWQNLKIIENLFANLIYANILNMFRTFYINEEIMNTERSENVRNYSSI